MISPKRRAAPKEGSMHFAKKLKHFMPQRNLRYLLHDHLSGFERPRGLQKVHASELTRAEGFCPRFYALADASKARLKDQWLGAADVATFQLGRMWQDSIVHWFADMGRAVGHWRCLACNQLHEFQKRPVKCAGCGSRAFKPEEVRFESAISGASCGIDMMVDVGDPLLLPVEIKSMKKEEFAELLAPLAEHRLRTALYLRLIEESEHPWSSLVQHDRAKVLYVCKGGYVADAELRQWGLPDRYSPFKEFDVGRADQQTDELSRRAKVVKDYRSGAVAMPAGICASALAKRARSCALCKLCFSGDHPPAYQWQDQTA
jgi:rubrerythrin